MKSRILFSHSYFMRFDPKQWATGQPYAPIGTLYSASLLRKNGYNVSFFDSMFAYGPEEVILPLQEQHPRFFILYDDGFNYLTKMCLTNMREAAFEMIQWAKLNHCIVIVSSSDATDHFDKYLAAGADYVLLGEAEYSLVELVNALENEKESMEQIAGISYKGFNGYVKTQKRNVIKDLDSLPLPACSSAST